MITIIFKGEPDAHKKIQDWRKEHNKGFLVNLHSKKNVMLHSVECPVHLGDTNWEEGRLNWNSLGNSTKICGTDREQLVTWVKNYYETELKTCKDCNP